MLAMKMKNLIVSVEAVVQQIGRVEDVEPGRAVGG